MSRRSIPKKRTDLPVHVACLSGNKGSLKSIVSSVPRRALEIKDSLGRTPLILTVTRNNVECGTVLLKAGVTVDNTDNAGQTALHIASSKGFHHFVRLLLTYKASWMQRDYFGASALHMAAINPNVKGLSAIVKHVKPAEIDIQDSTLKTALHWSAAYACNENIKILLSQGANICIPDKDGKTPLHWAVANSNPEALDCVKTLLKKESSLINWQDYEGRSPLHIAVNCGSEEILYFLASRENCNADLLDNSFCTPLHCAAKRGLSEKADILLKKRASHLSCDDHGATPLHYAAYNNHAKTVMVFASKNYISDEPDSLGRNALMWAAIQSAESSIRVLAASAESLSLADRNGLTALHAAAIYGHADAVKLLVNLGHPVDLKDKYGMTPFLKACEFGRSKAAQALLDLGANMNEKDINSCSALHWCAKGGSAYLSQILIRRGADYNIQDSLSMAPLHYASARGDFINCTCVLVESGANQNIVDSEGKTPLHASVLNGRLGITRYLLDHDSNVNVMFLKKDWVTPLDCAMLTGNIEIIILLKRYGAICAEDIKEFAAVVIQTWFRKKLKKKMQSLKSSENCSHPSLPSTSFDSEFILPSDSKCIPLSKVPSDFEKSLKYDDSHHVCNGCYHKIVCIHVCEKKTEHHSPVSKEHKAALIIQRTWKRYILKKYFARMRNEVASLFLSDDERLAEEELWQIRCDNFYQLLTE